MTEQEAAPESDRAAGAPHPRMTATLYGQEAAEREFLSAFNADRLHHGWLLTGPRGIGKATLAWRIARFLLTQPLAHEQGGGLFEDAPAEQPATLDPLPGHPALARIEALAEPRLNLLRIPWDEKARRFKQDITVDETRKLKSFFQLSAADGGRRVVIVDAADDLNSSAANALLKILEEPPADATLLLISHQPARLLPTIRSRCRELRCLPLGDDDLARAISAAGLGEGELTPALATLAAGSVGRALRLADMGGAEVYQAIVRLFGDEGGFDRARAAAMADRAGQRGQADNFETTVEMIDLFLSRLARSAVSATDPGAEAAKGEAALFARLAPNPGTARKWAELAQVLGQRARAGRAVNLDPAALILDMVLKINEAASATAA